MKIKKVKSSPKFFSSDFLIQNHTDISLCALVLILVSLLFEPISKHTLRFVSLQYNVTDLTNTPQKTEDGLPIVLYTYGFNDIFCVLFGTTICIVIHGIVQQYLLDKSSRKLHLSKIKHSKFNESGQLLAFYCCSILWALDLIRRDRYSQRSWSQTIGGSQNEMSYGVKLFYVIQISYWIHCLPMYFFERTKKEDILARSTYVGLYLAVLIGSYLFGITRFSLILLVLHYCSEALFHYARISYFKQNRISSIAFKIWNVVFLIARICSITLSILVFYLEFGVDDSVHSLNIFTRFAILAIVFAIQSQLMWRYLVFHLARLRPPAPAQEPKKGNKRERHD